MLKTQVKVAVSPHRSGPRYNVRRPKINTDGSVNSNLRHVNKNVSNKAVNPQKCKGQGNQTDMIKIGPCMIPAFAVSPKDDDKGLDEWAPWGPGSRVPPTSATVDLFTLIDGHEETPAHLCGPAACRHAATFRARTTFKDYSQSEKNRIDDAERIRTVAPNDSAATVLLRLAGEMRRVRKIESDTGRGPARCRDKIVTPRKGDRSRRVDTEEIAQSRPSQIRHVEIYDTQASCLKGKSKQKPNVPSGVFGFNVSKWWGA